MNPASSASRHRATAAAAAAATAAAAAASSLLEATCHAQENALEDEIGRYDALLLDDDGALDALRERRLQQLKQRQRRQQEWKQAGHGEYVDLGSRSGGDVAKSFFEAARRSQRLVVHFYRPTTQSCDVFHGHLAALARNHLETRFVKVDVDGVDGSSGNDRDSGTAYLVEKLGIVVMPTLLLVENRKAKHHVRGFDELGGTTEFETEDLEQLLAMHGMLTPRDGDAEMDPEEFMDRMRSKQRAATGTKIRHLTTSSARRKGGGTGNEDGEEEDF